MKKSKHRHRVKTSSIVGWALCVADGPCNGNAHGGATFVDRCSCGAVRMTESNGRYSKRGSWYYEDF